jgi:predicted ABC-type exoprotein transport system permease subunit
MLKKDSIAFESVRLLVVISVALCLIPAGAHFFELPNKMFLSTAEYMTTQKIYAGWAFFGVAIIAAIVFTLTHTLMVRAKRTAFVLSLTALLCLGATQVIFWTSTYPMNVATNNWTNTPQNFAATMGVFARGQRGAYLCGVGGYHPLRAHLKREN